MILMGLGITAYLILSICVLVWLLRRYKSSLTVVGFSDRLVTHTVNPTILIVFTLLALLWIIWIPLYVIGSAVNELS